ncbi:MAG: hypothetical protein HUU43_03780 [Ignavibacteriaceae bacterium]|nr:hypothetical protein [Ignavibacteriaceae bacterium]NUM69944.1 hypothetical protein [Ignavibacteriaceae bacterium]
MTTLPAPGVIPAKEDSIEKKAYSIAEALKDFMPVANDRNRLGFMIYKYLTGKGDAPEIMVPSGKFSLKGITVKEFVKLLEKELRNKG